MKDQRDLRFALHGDLKARARVVAALAAAGKSGAHTVILSGETLHKADPAGLAAIAQDAGWGNAELGAVAIVRDPAGWLNSRYAFETIGFRHRGSFEAFVTRELRDHRASWSHVFAAWMDAAPISFTALALRDRRNPAGIVPRALTALGVPDALAAAHEGSARNEAVDPRTVEAARRLAVHRIEKDGREAVRKARLVLVKRAEAEGFCGRFEGVDAALAARIEDRTRRSLDAFAARVWGAGWHEVYEGAARCAKSNEWRKVRGSQEEAAAIGRMVKAVEEARGLEGRGWRRLVRALTPARGSAR